MTIILNKLLEYSGLSAKAFSEKIGLDRPQAIYDIQKGKTKSISQSMGNRILSVFPDINKAWLFTGEGEMLKSGYDCTPAPGNMVCESMAGYYTVDTLPHIPYLAKAGSLTNSLDGLKENQCEREPVVHQFTKYDFTIQVNGNSMFPYYHSGDVVACKMLKGTRWIQWGRTHVLDTAQGVIMKRIYDADDGIRCVSFNNEEFPEFVIPKEEIYSISLVVGTIRGEN